MDFPSDRCILKSYMGLFKCAEAKKWGCSWKHMWFMAFFVTQKITVFYSMIPVIAALVTRGQAHSKKALQVLLPVTEQVNIFNNFRE